MSQPPNSVPIAVYASYGTSQPQASRSASRWRNQPQSNSVAAGGLIFLSAGMNMAQGVGWNHGSFFGSLEHFRFSWFVGVIIGAILAAPLANLFPKKFMLAFSSLLILIEGIIFTSAPYEYEPLLAGRYLNGIGVGFATIPFFIHASEISANTYRGSCLAIEQYGVCFGIAIQVIYASQWGSTAFPANRLHGIFDIIFAVGAMASLLYFIESPIFFIRKGDEAAALDCLSRLQRPQGVTSATTVLLEEHKNYVRENENYTLMEGIKRGILPLVKIIFFRSMMVAFCFSLPLNTALQFSLLANFITWPPIVAACLRIFGAFIALILVDGLGRKLPSLIFIVITGALIIAIGAMFSNFSNLYNSYDMSVVTSLSLLTQFFAGLFVPFTSIYMGEAFPLVVKPYFIGVSVIIEQLIHIIIIVTFVPYISSIFDSLLAQGIIMVVFFLFLCTTMPETRKISLKEAQDRFRHLFHLNLY
ncbi:uncharacterized protein LOC135957177 [Calliphora vicina]|uniref:uncharacterized protein LOC135957177 n=1 Tax=Calliphora vicina TaxID=7373 RepID=UPI00325BC6AF